MVHVTEKIGIRSLAQAAELFVRELRLGKIGKVTFELPEDIVVSGRVQRGARRGY